MSEIIKTYSVVPLNKRINATKEIVTTQKLVVTIRKRNFAFLKEKWHINLC